MTLFAQATAITDYGWLSAAVIQGGALVILGYHMLWGLPSIFAKLSESHKEVIQILTDETKRSRVDEAERQKEFLKVMASIARAFARMSDSVDGVVLQGEDNTRRLKREAEARKLLDKIIASRCDVIQCPLRAAQSDDRPAPMYPQRQAGADPIHDS